MSAKTFQDHFSGHASDYASFRPRYPSDLFRLLAGLCTNHDVAWDCATGNGQAAIALEKHFKLVLATDASSEQIAAATRHPNIRYSVRPAEKSGFDDATVDLVTVAQAFHWFDIDVFLAEMARVLRKSGVLAVWSYEKCTVSPDVDLIIDAIFDEVENYWPPEREIVMNHYRGITLPWQEVEMPQVTMDEKWTVEQMLGYCRTWSASKRYFNDHGQDPVALHEGKLRQAWADKIRTVRWPVAIRVSCR